MGRGHLDGRDEGKSGVINRIHCRYFFDQKNRDILIECPSLLRYSEYCSI